MKLHPFIAVMNGSKPWIITFSRFYYSTKEAQAQSTIASPPTNSTQKSKGTTSHGLSIVQTELLLVSGLFLLIMFLLYMARHYTNRTRLQSNQPAVASAPTTPDVIITIPRGRGVDQSIIDTFPVIGYAAVKILRTSKSPLECAICLSEFVDDDILRLLPGCRHVFHADCIGAWLENHVTCPVCRSNLSDPEVLSGKRLLSMNSELEDFNSSPAISEPEQTNQTDGSSRVKEIRRTRSITEGWGRFTLTLPEQVVKEIEVAGKHRRSASVQDYTHHQGNVAWMDGKLHAFFKSFSRNGRNRGGDDMSTVAEGVESSVSAATSSRQLIEPSINGEVSETAGFVVEVDLTDLPVHQRV